MDDASAVNKPISPVTAPADWYVDPALWPSERQAIFANNWQFLAHDSDLAEPRSYRADVLAGFPVLIVRGDDGEVRAFHNVCRHRAGPLVRDEAGLCDGHLTCAYHGWKYTLDGRLRAARDFGAASDFDPREYGLFPIRLAVWRGLIFAGIGEHLPDFAAQMAPLDGRTSRWVCAASTPCTATGRPMSRTISKAIMCRPCTRHWMPRSFPSNIR